MLASISGRASPSRAANTRGTKSKYVKREALKLFYMRNSLQSTRTNRAFQFSFQMLKRRKKRKRMKKATTKRKRMFLTPARSAAHFQQQLWRID